MHVINQIATELNVRPQQVAAAVNLLDEGATVPFIARYRKEITEGLDDTQLRQLEVRLDYLRELEARRLVVIASIREQGFMTDELEALLRDADTKTRLEDLYLPFKPKRRTKAQIAREAGLEPLADLLLSQPDLSPEAQALPFVHVEAGVADVAAALEGARQILMERMAEDAVIAGTLREQIWKEGRLQSMVAAGKEATGSKFADYFAFDEALTRLPSHRILALLRGRNEAVLNLTLWPASDSETGHLRAEQQLARQFAITNAGRPGDAWLMQCVHLAWRIKLFTRIELDIMQRLREAAEQEAIRVFSSNVRDLLLAAPAGQHITMGLDPGLRTGVKVAVVDATGQLLETATIYPHVPQKQWDQSIAKLAHMADQHGVSLVSIGNGTASRETDQLVAALMQQHPSLGLTRMVVSEAGASVYSASELAAKEFPGLDVSLRGAVSIARRLQDPLAELVKIDPKAIGVGQYQHDVSQTQLAKSLDAVVEDCVNAVGVDVNTASVSLLRYVSGLSQTVAENIVLQRNQLGPYKTRADLQQVPRLGAKTFEQSAGFLRIRGGVQPLDASAVHPEAYPVVQRMLKTAGKSMPEVLGNVAWLRSVDAASYIDEKFGLPTVRDILVELEKPGRDPRPAFITAKFREGVTRLADLKPDMMLEGVVTNVTNFGAFVDIGVHQDGLVHLSHLADRFVATPRDVVKAGDVVTVRVLEVDVERKRIALSMRKQRQDDPLDKSPASRAMRTPDKARTPGSQGKPQPAGVQGAMAAAWARASKEK